jgi:hypothetical protein
VGIKSYKKHGGSFQLKQNQHRMLHPESSRTRKLKMIKITQYRYKTFLEGNYESLYFSEKRLSHSVSKLITQLSIEHIQGV